MPTARVAENCRGRKRKVSTSVAKTLTLASEWLGSLDAHTSMSEHASRLSREEESEVKLETMVDKQNRNLKTLANFIV